MKRMIFTAAAAATLTVTGFVAGRNCQVQPREEAPMGGQACRITTATEDSARMIELLAKRAIRQTAPALRHELGAGFEGDAEIHYVVSVNRSGKLRLLYSLTSCQGRQCPGESELPEIIGIMLASEWTMEPQKDPCLLEIGVKVPALGTGGPVIEPRTGIGIEL